jgi:hypothetical protein
MLAIPLPLGTTYRALAPSPRHTKKAVTVLPRLVSIVSFCSVIACVSTARAETEEQRELRTNEAQTAEPGTDKPLKAAMQNLFLQEDAFPQQHFQVQTGLRLAAADLNDDEPGLALSAGVELGLADSWTVSARAPIGFLPADERGLGNAEIGLLYSEWVSRHEDFRLTTNLRTVLPGPAGDNAFAHDLSAIGYARWAPFHMQVVLTVDVSYGSDVSPSPRVRPEGAIAALLKLEKVAWVLEATVQQEFMQRSYMGALGFFWYPGSFEIGIAAVLDVTKSPITIGATSIVSYAFDPPS